MKKRRLGLVAVFAIGTVLVLSACGGGGGGAKDKRLTKAEFAAKANTLCAVFNKKAAAAKTPTSVAEVAVIYGKLLPVYDKLVADMKKLKPPASEDATFKQVLALGKEQSKRVSAIIAAAKKNDLATAIKLGKDSDTNDKQSDALFKKLGATECMKG